MPITKFDVKKRLHFLLRKCYPKNLENYYNQSLKVLINEKIIFHGKKNKNLSSLVSKKAITAID